MRATCPALLTLLDLIAGNYFCTHSFKNEKFCGEKTVLNLKPKTSVQAMTVPSVCHLRHGYIAAYPLPSVASLIERITSR